MAAGVLDSAGSNFISKVGFRWKYGPVAADEMAFAMAVFLAAAQRKILPKKQPESEDELRTGQAGKRVFVALAPQTGIEKNPESFGCTLSEAFLALWQHYAGDDRQASICARVLGFHLLMERTEGVAVEPWLGVDPEDSETVFLQPTVVQALASVPLLEQGKLPEGLFLETIRVYAAGMAFDLADLEPGD